MATPASKPWHTGFGISALHCQEYRQVSTEVWQKLKPITKGGYSLLVLRKEFNFQADG